MASIIISVIFLILAFIATFVVMPLFAKLFQMIFKFCEKYPAFNSAMTKVKNIKILKIETDGNISYAIRKGWLRYKYLSYGNYHCYEKLMRPDWLSRRYTFSTIQKVGEVWERWVIKNHIIETEIFIEKEK